MAGAKPPPPRSPRPLKPRPQISTTPWERPPVTPPPPPRWRPPDRSIPAPPRRGARRAARRAPTRTARPTPPPGWGPPPAPRGGGSVAGTGGLVRWELLDAAGRLLVQSDGTSATDPTPRIDQPLAPGKYNLEIIGQGAGPATISYVLTTDFQPSQPPFQPLNG